MERSYFILLVLGICLLFTGQVGAFSLSPGSHNFVYDERVGLDEEFAFILSSRSSEDMDIEVSLRGELVDYLEINEDDMFLEDGGSLTVPMRLTLPEGLDKVGANDVIISFRRMVPSEDEGGMMAVTYSLGARVRVNFAYPGEFISISKLEPVHVNQGEDTVVDWEIEALGVNTTFAESNLVITDFDGGVVFEESFSSVALERHEVRSYSTQIPSSDFNPGSYDVYLESVSGDNEYNSSAVLRIGEEDVELISFSPKNFTQGELGEFSFVIGNLWNDDFDNVYAVFEVEDVSMTTRSMPLPAFGSTEFDEQFINLRDLDEGYYNGSLSVFFGDNVKSFDVEILIKDESDNNFVTWVIIISVVLGIVILLLVLLFFHVNKKSGSK